MNQVRLGLRARSTVATAVGAMLVTLLLSVGTYGSVRSYLLAQRDRVALRQAALNARVVKDVLRDPNADVGELLAGLQSEPGSFVFVHHRDDWFSNAVGPGEGALPGSLRDGVLDGGAGRQRFTLGGRPHLAVGMAIPAVEAGYVEVFTLDSLERTLAALRNSLLVTAALASMGGAALGYWSSRRVLRPVTKVAAVADSIAHGGLDSRLEDEADADLQRLVRSFNDMADALQMRIAREARFASDVSHELRTPLAALTASASVLQGRRDDLSERAQQALDIMQSQITRFSQLVLDLLEISRLDAGASDVHLEPVRIDELVRKTAAAHDYTDLPVRAEGAPATEVMADKRRLERILANLLDNARIHGDGATALVVTTHPSEDGGELRIAVEDHGPGIAPGDEGRIFERFARGTASHGTPGSGLGLALAAEHARVLGGRLWVENRREGGARFVLALPMEVFA